MFIHHNPHRPGKLSHKVSRGFTAYVSTQGALPGHCYVQIAHCNAKDEFNKKLGRSYAQQAPETMVPIRQLPKFLGEHAAKCDSPWMRSLCGYEGQFLYVLKNFV